MSFVRENALLRYKIKKTVHFGPSAVAIVAVLENFYHMQIVPSRPVLKNVAQTKTPHSTNVNDQLTVIC